MQFQASLHYNKSVLDCETPSGADLLEATKGSLNNVFSASRNDVCVLTDIKGDVFGFNNHEPEAVVQKLPLCENKHEELHVCSFSLVTLLINMNADFKKRVFCDSVLSAATYRHLHMVSPFVVLLVDNFKKVPPLSRQSTRQQKHTHVKVISDTT